MKRLVLVGAGHAHALVLRDAQRQALPGVEVVVVSPEAMAPYSGMVPGWLAGHYRFEDIAIDFAALAAAAGARWCPGELQRLAPDDRQLHLADGRVLDYDVLSLNVGSTLTPPTVAHAQVLPLRPLSLLRRRYEALLQAWQADALAPSGGSDRPFTVSAVGGGPAGFEALLAVLHQLRALRPQRPVEGHWFTRHAELLPSLAPAARRAARRALDRAQVTLHLGCPWTQPSGVPSDVLLWATGAEAQAWQRDAARRGSLAVDAQGFVAIDAQLRAHSHPEIFAVGDCASWPDRPLPKAGVHAVRMGPVLAANLRAALAANGTRAAGQVLTHRPQRHALALLATGDGRAIASRSVFGAEGAWAWRWKDRIDRRFLSQFTHLPAASAVRSSPSA